MESIFQNTQDFFQPLLDDYQFWSILILMYTRGCSMLLSTGSGPESHAESNVSGEGLEQGSL